MILKESSGFLRNSVIVTVSVLFWFSLIVSSSHNVVNYGGSRDEILDPWRGFCLIHERGVPQNIYSQDTFLRVRNISRFFYAEHLPTLWPASDNYLDNNFTQLCPQLSASLHRRGEGSCCRSEALLYVLTKARRDLRALGAKYCDTCLENFMNFLCRALCHPAQSQFLSIEEVIQQEESDRQEEQKFRHMSVIRNVTIFADSEDLDYIWKSCVEVDRGQFLRRICELADSGDCSDAVTTLKAGGLMEMWLPFYYTFVTINTPIMWRQPRLNANIGPRTRRMYPLMEEYYFPEVELYDCNEISLIGHDQHNRAGCPCRHCHTACSPLDAQRLKANPESEHVEGGLKDIRFAKLVELDEY